MTPSSPLRVGLIGVNADTGWARESHVPALQALEGLELAAIATTNRASAAAAAAAFGAPASYSDPGELFADTRLDIVTVAAPVPAHRDLILGAIAAGKHVYSEWPLGVDADQSIALAASARTAGVRTAIGLQATANPVAQEARRLLASGAIGRPVSVAVLSTTAGFGPEIPQSALYLEDPAAAMNLTTIQTAHTLHFVAWLLEPFASVSAWLSTQFPDLLVGDPPCAHHRTIADHVLVQGRTRSGVPVAVEVAGGRRPQATPFRLDVIGQAATLRLRGGAPRGFQAGRLSLLLDGQEHAVDGQALPPVDDPALNVASVYATLRDDILAGTSTSAGFDEAIGLTALLEAVVAADAGGVRQNVSTARG